jgi:hypothetical protein
MEVEVFIHLFTRNITILQSLLMARRKDTHLPGIIYRSIFGSECLNIKPYCNTLIYVLSSASDSTADSQHLTRVTNAGPRPPPFPSRRAQRESDDPWEPLYE